jgi:hypothetical protein
MRLLTYFLFFITTWASAQVIDGTLKTQNNSTIYNTVFSPTRHGNMFNSIIDSKASGLSPLFRDSVDLTKKVRFLLSGIGTATTRNVTWPDKSGTVAFLDDVSGGNYTPQGNTVVTVGGIASGTDLGLSPISLQDLLDDMFYPYVNPVFTSFSITGQATTVEVGTTLTGSKTFVWNINENSGTVSTIDLYNVTTSTTFLAGTPNDGTQAQSITTVQLNSNGTTQSWRGVGNNTDPAGTFNSSNFTVTARYYRFFGIGDEPTNSAEVRALPNSAFHTGASTFTFTTGTSATEFTVALPPGVTISSVIDLTNLNANITSNFILVDTVDVLDAGSTNRAYNIYVYTIGSPYPESATLQVTTAN